MAVVPAAPGVQDPVGVQGHDVLCPSSNEGESFRPADRLRHESVDQVAVPQLSEAVESPGPDLAVPVPGQGKSVARDHGTDIGQTRNRGEPVRDSDAAAQAQLARWVGPGTVHTAARQDQAVLGARRRRHGVGKDGAVGVDHRNPAEDGVGTGVAETALADRICTPRQHPVSDHRDVKRVAGPGGQLRRPVERVGGIRSGQALRIVADPVAVLVPVAHREGPVEIGNRVVGGTPAVRHRNRIGSGGGVRIRQGRHGQTRERRIPGNQPREISFGQGGVGLPIEPALVVGPDREGLRSDRDRHIVRERLKAVGIVGRKHHRNVGGPRRGPVRGIRKGEGARHRDAVGARRGQPPAQHRFAERLPIGDPGRVRRRDQRLDLVDGEHRRQGDRRSVGIGDLHEVGTLVVHSHRVERQHGVGGVGNVDPVFAPLVGQTPGHARGVGRSDREGDRPGHGHVGGLGRGSDSRPGQIGGAGRIRAGQ